MQQEKFILILVENKNASPLSNFTLFFNKKDFGKKAKFNEHGNLETPDIKIYAKHGETCQEFFDAIKDTSKNIHTLIRKVHCGNSTLDVHIIREKKNATDDKFYSIHWHDAVITATEAVSKTLIGGLQLNQDTQISFTLFASNIVEFCFIISE